MPPTRYLSVLALAAACEAPQTIETRRPAAAPPPDPAAPLVAAAPARAPAPAPAVNPAPDDDSVGGLELAPGTAIGPFQIGMDRQAVSTQGLAVEAEGPRVVRAGPFRITLDARNRVETVEVPVQSLNPGLRCRGRLVPPTLTTLRDVAALLPDCGPTEHTEGGDVVRCAGGSLLVKGSTGQPIRVQIQRPPPARRR